MSDGVQRGAKGARSIILGLGALALAALGFARSASAYPEFVRNGYFSCMSCHVSPSGGGTLNAYGRGFAAEKLSTWSYKGEEQPLHGAVGELPESVAVGGDFRQIQVNSETAGAKDGRWIPMQRDLSACGKLSITWTCATAGLLARDPDDDMKYGVRLASVRADLGESGVLRVGRFFPRYGLMIADHTATIRQGLGFSENHESDQAEATYVSEFVEGTVYHDFGRVVRFSGDTHESNEAFDPANGGFLAVALGKSSRVGLSYRREEHDKSTQHDGGAFAALGPSKEVYILAEVDNRTTIAKDQTATTPHIARAAESYVKVGYEVMRGLVPYLLDEVDFQDLRHGATRTDQLGLGTQWYPRPHFELDGMWGYRLQRQDFTYASTGYLLLHYYL